MTTKAVVRAQEIALAVAHEKIATLRRERDAARDAIVEARLRLAKGAGKWNGPVFECDGVLRKALENFYHD